MNMRLFGRLEKESTVRSSRANNEKCVIKILRPVKKKCKNDEEIVAVLAHELGHWKLNHSVYFFISIQIRTLLHFGGYALLRNSSSLFHTLGDMQSYFVEWSFDGL